MTTNESLAQPLQYEEPAWLDPIEFNTILEVIDYMRDAANGFLSAREVSMTATEEVLGQEVTDYRCGPDYIPVDQYMYYLALKNAVEGLTDVLNDELEKLKRRLISKCS
jgi:aminoglycoside phosphotransferase family enzyme